MLTSTSYDHRDDGEMHSLSPRGARDGEEEEEYDGDGMESTHPPSGRGDDVSSPSSTNDSMDRDFTIDDDDDDAISRAPMHRGADDGAIGYASASSNAPDSYAARVGGGTTTTCDWIVGKSRAIVLGQLLAFWLASTGLVQSKLHLDCNLSAPMFSTLSFYVPLSMVCIGLLLMDERRREADGKVQSYSSTLSSDDDDRANDHRVPSMAMRRRRRQQRQRQRRHRRREEDVRRDSVSLNNVAHHPTAGGMRMSRIRAKPEKRNHLLSRWSEISTTAEIAEEEEEEEEEEDEEEERDFQFDDDDGEDDDDQGSIDDDADHPPSSRVVVRTDMPYTLFGLISMRVPKWKYALVATLDVYAQYTTILAYKYTTITNVALYDAFAIPSAMIVSSCLFGRRYTRVHIVAVMACVIGIALNVIQDYAEDERVATEDASQESEQEQYLAAEYPYKVAGDALAIVGGVLFGISNTLQEVTVKDGSLLEYLGCFTFFASIIASVQAMFFERGEIAAFYGQSSDETCSRSEGELLFFIFAIGGMVTYAGVGAFLQFSDAAFFNLSLLTGDAWAVIFSVFAEGIKPPPTFYIALAITLSGVIMYETAPSPVIDNSQEENIGDLQLTENISSTRRRDPSVGDGLALT